MITREQAALRAELILELPADDPEHDPRGWNADAHVSRCRTLVVTNRDNCR
jgi:hypothetical protein